jgi:hypothetical protein
METSSDDEQETPPLTPSSSTDAETTSSPSGVQSSIETRKRRRTGLPLLSSGRTRREPRTLRCMFLLCNVNLTNSISQHGKNILKQLKSSMLNMVTLMVCDLGQKTTAQLFSDFFFVAK